jgi:hypothetical protein
MSKVFFATESKVEKIPLLTLMLVPETIASHGLACGFTDMCTE